MVACTQVRCFIRRCSQHRLLANSWGILTSHHAQSLPLSGRRYWRVNREDPSGMMPSSQLHVHLGLVDPGGLETWSHPPGQVWSRKIQVSSGGDVPMLPQELQESLWRQFFSDPTQWWDNRRSKPTPRHPDFRHKKSKVGLWLNNQHKPPWVDSQLDTWDAEVETPPGSVYSSAERQGEFGRSGSHEDDLEVRMCRKLCEIGQISEAVNALIILVQRDCHVPGNLFHNILRWCITHKDLALGRRVHALTIQSGYEGHTVLATHLMVLYVSLGRLDEAMRIFTKLSTPSSTNWATIIVACAGHGLAAEAIGLYRQMRRSTSLNPTDRIYVAVLKACAAVGDIVAGKEVHGHILASPGKPNIFLQTGLVNMYAKCRNLEVARGLFDTLPDRNVVTWTAMIAGYADQGMGLEALSLYSTMQKEGITTPNSVTYVCLLQACANVGVGALETGAQLHAQIKDQGLQDDVVVGGSLVNMYAKCGSIEGARNVFDRLPNKNVVTWTAMIAGYAEQGMGREALSLYSSMQEEVVTSPNSVTFVCLLQACAIVGMGALHQGKQLHSQIKERGLQDEVVVGGSLVNMYAKCGNLHDACSVFDRLPAKNVVTWNAMITSYTQHGMGKEALSLFGQMEQEGIAPDSVTYVGLLQACASVGIGALHQGKRLHTLIEDRKLLADVVLGTSLVNMYAKCGSLEDARNVFDKFPVKNIVTWNAMLAGYAQQGKGQDALSLYSGMQQEGITTPNSVTFLCLLQACAIVAALPQGKQLHAQIEEQGLQAAAGVGAALVNMYAKCGSMFDSQQVFDILPERTIEAWNALTGGYTCQGDSEIVFALLDRMRLEGMQPNGITFLNLLTVCSHVGLVDKGRKYFEAMNSEYGISPTLEHYTCMMDLLGRAGHLAEAVMMARTMPFSPNSTVWHTLLGSCRKWTNVEIGEQVLEFALTVDVKDAASYVLMSDIYASARMWEERREMQRRRVKSGAWKKPGQSWWTDKGGVAHTFVVGDKKHPESKGIYARLEELVPTEERRILSTLSSSLWDISHDKENA